jgi:tetratricopeptide (TPR) repeat protein
VPATEEPLKTRLTIQALLLIVFSLAASAQMKKGVSRYTLPGKTGALQIALGGLKIERTELSGDGPQIGVAAGGESDLALSIFIKPAEKPGPSSVCRDTWWPRTEAAATGELKTTLQGKRLYRKGPMALVEFFTPRFQSRTINEKSIHAYVAAGDLWIEIQLSKKQYKPQDQVLFDRVLNSVEALPAYVNTSRDYAGFGGYFFVKDDYSGAARYYQQALDLEKKSPALDQRGFEVMIDELAAAQLATHDLQNAQAAIQYGISRYPDYPLFYYNMAAVDAELDRMDDCIEQLRAAWKRRANVLPGEQFPDPSTDGYFRRFMKNERFVEALREMQRL